MSDLMDELDRRIMERAEAAIQARRERRRLAESGEACPICGALADCACVSPEERES